MTTAMTIWAPMFWNLSSSSISDSGDAILGDGQGAEGLIQHHVAAFRAQGPLTASARMLLLPAF